MDYALKLRTYRASLSLLCLLLLAWGGERLWSKHQRDKLRGQAYEPPPPGMVFVPADEFLMGSDDANADPDERPLRKVFLPVFYIDRFEVTNRRYKEFKSDHRYPPGEDDFPVTFVLKHDAEESSVPSASAARRARNRMKMSPKPARQQSRRRRRRQSDINAGCGCGRIGTNRCACLFP